MTSLTSEDVIAEALRELRRELPRPSPTPRWAEAAELIAQLAPVAPGPFSVGEDGSIVCGGESILHSIGRERFDRVLQALIPWRKGPFRLCGTLIDAEWRSDMKWNRLAPWLPALNRKSVLDIGSGNGYFLFRALDAGASCAVGFDPAELSLLQFSLIQHFQQEQRATIEAAGFQHTQLVENLFDVVLCMGVVYHHPDPLAVIRAAITAAAPGGNIIIESIVVPGEDPAALFPPQRYAKMRNVYFLPTVSCLAAWMERCGLTEIEPVDISPVTTQEQRSTPFSPGESLVNFLDPGDPARTVEGHPAPARAIVRAKKRRGN